MSTPMDIDPPTSSAASEITLVDDVKGKGKEEKPRFEVKKVCLQVSPFFFLIAMLISII